MKIKITTQLVKNLIRTQFPQFEELTIKPVEKDGHDNRTFHLGEEMTVRLPSDEPYAAQIEKEWEWLPQFKGQLSLPIPSPIAMGDPAFEYPFHWSINNYIPGETLSHESITDLKRLAIALALFLAELQRIDTINAPGAGAHNFHRGGDLRVYHQQTTEALHQQRDILPIEKLKDIWDQALESRWDKPAVWVHGDIAPGNLIVNNGLLSGVIDFGVMAAGDPACDLVIAWTFFDAEIRELFLQKLNCDNETINRAKGWALWKAVITYDDHNSAIATSAKNTISCLLNQ